MGLVVDESATQPTEGFFAIQEPVQAEALKTIVSRNMLWKQHDEIQGL